MKKLWKIISSALLFLPLAMVAENNYSVFVDKDGVMRRDDNGEEVSFYGTNYTVPFAHAYRALDRLGVDHKAAIDRDVYHMSRLGFNAFRLHLWDVEIADGDGNLIENDHLQLLDYLIAELEKRGISIVLTAQTNFGNGYPERNIDTGSFTYLYDKCNIHENPEAQAKQARYLEALARHTNQYTGRKYSEDRSIIAMEINNEPCHSGTSKEVTAYINKMTKALKKGGWKKPVLYNVSHNPSVTDAYYKADIQGTTYQWYPTGLVAGHERKGNFLPNVDSYDIPFKNLPGFDSKAKVVYEFDPADVLYSHLYPAVARTFRKEGFQWITQFAYDPIDMAWANSEYQTHFLNLAYTPNKALSMKIAAEVAREIPRGADLGKYPADTIFGDFRVSYHKDLSEYNNGKKFFYSNNTNTFPVDPAELTEIAGVGSSPIVRYDGSGAYFLDRLNDDIWRLEIMPDITLTSDPFNKPSLDKKVGYISHNLRKMTIALPSLGQSYIYEGINDGNHAHGEALNGSINIKPGVYLLAKEKDDISEISYDSPMGHIRLNEYVAPAQDSIPQILLHTPPTAAIKGSEVEIAVRIIGSDPLPDSIVIMPGNVSMWSSHNPVYSMTPSGKDGEFFATINTPDKNNSFDYYVVTFRGDRATTFPEGISDTPLDWDFLSEKKYSIPLYSPNDPIILINPIDDFSNVEVFTIPDSWRLIDITLDNHTPAAPASLAIKGNESIAGHKVIAKKRMKETLDSFRSLPSDAPINIAVGTAAGTDSITISVVDSDGITYSTTLPVISGKTLSTRLTDLTLSPTALLPAPYPTFLGREFMPDKESVKPQPGSWSEIEEIRITVNPDDNSNGFYLPILGVWIDPVNRQ